MLLFEPYGVVTNLSKSQLDEDEMDLLKNGLDFSIPDFFCQFNMIIKFMTQELNI